MKINILNFRNHSKASERYVDVVFKYKDNSIYEASIPIQYRRTGAEIEDKDVDAYLEKVYVEVNSKKWPAWRAEQANFWSTKLNAGITQAFFDTLSKNFVWCCVACCLPANPNFARRIQDLKEFGFTIATKTSSYCATCSRNTTQLMLLPIKRGGITGYENWSPALRVKIINFLKTYDAFEAKTGKKENLLPDHKFPEIRWDSNTRRESLEHLSEKEIQRDFQLLSNQRNQQKREVCRGCFQSGIRGVIYGISFYYQGSSKWDDSIAKIGKIAETGCVGCGWYDIEKWRSELAKKLCNHEVKTIITPLSSIQIVT